jgi:hypothetical protein
VRVSLGIVPKLQFVKMILILKENVLKLGTSLTFSKCIHLSNRGCATKTECTNPLTGQIYTGQKVTGNSTEPAGMKIAVECCKASKFADDDALAVDMGQICNSSSRVVVGVASTIAGLFVALVLAFNY